MIIVNGKEIAQKIIDNLKQKSEPKKIFAAILVGENPISLNFLKQKEKVAKELGIDFRIYKFPETIKNDDLRKEVGKIALLKKVGGVIVQLPLPEHLNKHYIINAIPREKDVDVLSERSLGAFYNERNPILPPSVETVIEILKKQTILFENNVSKTEQLNDQDHFFLKIKPLTIAVIGAGFLIGKPIAVWLMNKVKKITIFEKGSNLSELKEYDLIISGVGKARIIKPEMLKKDSGIIDFGYSIGKSQSANRKSLIYGDFDIERLAISDLRLAFYTPTPNGTGPILVAKIFENFYKLNAEIINK